MFEIKSRHLISVLSLFTIISIALANIIPAGAFSLNSTGIATTDPSLRQNSAINTPETPYVKGVVLVGLKPGISLESNSSLSGEPDLSTSSSSLTSTLTRVEVRSVENVFPVGQDAIAPSIENSLKAGSQVDLSTIYRLKLDPSADVLAAIQSLSSDPAVLFAEPDYIAMKADIPNTTIKSAPSLALVNDPLYSQQWGLEKINIEAAWMQTQGNPAVILAIIDSGIDLTHPDLAAHLWVNPGEIAGNGLDDDNNGFVDDVNGWNFVAGNNYILDDNGHGTLVAGVAAAIAGNGLGIAGTCPECTILPVKVMQVSGSANYSDIAAGILYAAQKGARVINLSLGGYADSNTLRNAIEAAANTAQILQFISGGHALGFAADGMYAVTGTHAMYVDFEGVNSIQPQVDSLASPSTNISGTMSLGAGADEKIEWLYQTTVSKI